MNEIHSLLHYSLKEALRHPKCASEEWMSTDIGRMRVTDSDVKTLYWINDDFEMVSITFPAKLNLDGPYNQLAFDFNDRHPRKVRLLNLHLSFFLLKRRIVYVEIDGNQLKNQEYH